jgi:hypothetical protein
LVAVDRPLSGATAAMHPSIDLDDIVRKSIHALRTELGKQRLSNRVFGVKLHAHVARRIAKLRPLQGWYIAAETPVRAIPFVRRDLLEQPFLITSRVPAPACICTSTT